MRRIKAWHFVDDDGKRRDRLVEQVGETYHYEGTPVMCESGLHASRKILDALQYARGFIVRRVECWGKAAEDADKLVCKHRKVLWEKDITNVLHEFACRVAEDALTTAMVTDERCWNAIKVKRLWLKGEATDKDLAAAGDAAWDAAWDAWTAARAAAWTAARDAARNKYNTWLEEMVHE